MALPPGTDTTPKPKRPPASATPNTSSPNSFVSSTQKEGWGTIIYLTGEGANVARNLEDSVMKDNGWFLMDGSSNRWEFRGNGSPEATEPGALGYNIDSWASDSPTTDETIAGDTSLNPTTNAEVTNALRFWPSTDDIESYMLTGNRAWVNDEPVMDIITKLSQTSNRDYMSAPNGDFIAFFPDRTGFNGKAPVVMIRDIEVVDLDLKIVDENLTTHLISVGDVEPFGPMPTYLNLIHGGMVTIQMEDLMRYLLGLEEDDNVESMGTWMLTRFGLRPKRVEAGQIREAGWNFCLSIHLFQQLWASQWLTDVSFTFMPELYPGMRIELADHGLGLYIEGLTHSGSRTGGWITTCQVSTPMRRTKDGWKMLRAEWPSGILDVPETSDMSNSAMAIVSTLLAGTTPPPGAIAANSENRTDTTATNTDDGRTDDNLVPYGYSDTHQPALGFTAQVIPEGEE